MDDKLNEPRERDRETALEERRADWEKDLQGQRLEDRFGFGTFGCHEAVHMNSVILRLIEDELGTHSAVLLDPEWYNLVQTAQDCLSKAYRIAAERHLEK